MNSIHPTYYVIFKQEPKESPALPNIIKMKLMNTASDLFSGHGYSGNDGFSGTKPLDDAILFTNSGITALVELFLENFDVDLSKVEILKLTKIPKNPKKVL